MSRKYLEAFQSGDLQPNDERLGTMFTEAKHLERLIEDPTLRDRSVSEIMDDSFQFVGMDNTLDVLSSLINKDNQALLVRDDHNKVHIITKSDLLMAMSG